MDRWMFEVEDHKVAFKERKKKSSLSLMMEKPEEILFL